MPPLIQNILNSLVYDPQQPLLFHSTFFLFFFIVVLLFYPLVVNKVKVRTWYLMLASLYFYYKTSGSFIILLIITSLINFGLGALIYRAKSKAGKRFYLILSIVWNLGSLGYFKYTNFVISTVNQIFDVQLPLYDIVLPVGISFFTF